MGFVCWFGGVLVSFLFLKFLGPGWGCWLGRFVVSLLLVGSVCLLFFPVGFVGGGVQEVTTVLGSSVSYTLQARSGGVACTFDYVGVGERQPIPGPSSPLWQQVLLNGTQVFSEEITGRVHSDSPVDLYILNGNQLGVWVANRQPCNLTDGFIAFEPAVVDYSYALSTLAQSIPNFKNLDSNTLGVYFLLVNKSVVSSAHVTVEYQLSVVYGSSTITISSMSSVSSVVTSVSVSSLSLLPFPTNSVTGGVVVVTTQLLTLSSRMATASLTGSSSSASAGSSLGTTGSMSFMDLLLSGRLNALGAVATAGSVILGWFFTTRKRRFLSGYLTKIDSTYNSYAVNREECKGRLNQMKDDVAEMLKKGKIDVSHFGVLEGKISQYLRDLNSGGQIPPSPPPPPRDE